MPGSVMAFVQAAARAEGLEDFARATMAFLAERCEVGALWSRVGHGGWERVASLGPAPERPPEEGTDWQVVTVSLADRTTAVALNPPVLDDDERRLLAAVLEAGVRQVEARTAAEAATFSGDQRLATVLDAAPDAVIVVSMDGAILQANPQATELLGYSLAELVGSKLERLLPEELREVHVGHRARYAQAPTQRSMGAGQDLFARHRDGSDIPVDIALAPIEAGGRPAVAAFVRDATLRRQSEADRQQVREAELARRQASELNDNVVQGLTSAIWLLELDDPGTALPTLRDTLDEARQMMADLLGQAAAPPGAGELRRSVASSSAQLAALDAGVEDAGADGNVRVLVVDDVEAIRFMLGMRFRLTEGVTVVGEAHDGVAALEAVERLEPDVVLMDLSMPRMDGLEATAAIRTSHPQIRVVILTGHASESMRQQAMDAGADEYVEKGADFAELVAAVLGHPVAH